MTKKNTEKENQTVEQGQLALAPVTPVTISMATMHEMAKSIAASKMFGVADEDQALALMLLCQAEGIHPVLALRRYHIIEGKPAYRADALQGEFEKDGVILWHERNEAECSASFFRHKRDVDKEAVSRSKQRYMAVKAGKPEAEFAYPGEITIRRTMQDAIDKQVALTWSKDKQEWVLKKNWRQSPRQMLHARCLTEGVRAINPGLVAGIYTEDEIVDMGDFELDQRPQAEIPENVTERNVKQATANATGEPVSEPLQQVPDVFADPKVITKENFGELVCHIGKAEGEMLGKKIKELHPNVIRWLWSKWLDRLGPSSSESDMRLKKAIEFAHQAGMDAEKPESPKQEATGTALVAPAVSPQATAASTDLGAVERADLIKRLKDRCGDLVLTEDQALKYLRDGGLFDTDVTFDTAPDSALLYLWKNWHVFKGIVDNALKPKVTHSKKERKPRKKK